MLRNFSPQSQLPMEVRTTAIPINDDYDPHRHAPTQAYQIQDPARKRQVLFVFVNFSYSNI